MKLAIAVLLLVSCKPSVSEVRAMLAEEGCMCPCACATGPDAGVDAVVDAELDAAPDAPVDAAVDAAPDAPPDAAEVAPVDLMNPWTCETLTAGNGLTGTLHGADGAALDADGCYWTPWEEGRTVTRVCSGVTEVVKTLTSPSLNPEDVKPGDFDGDGVIDGVACGGPIGCAILFRGAPNVEVILPGSQGHGRPIQAAVRDMNGDGFVDIVFGSYAGSAAQPAVIAWLENPGPLLARTGAWPYHFMDIAGYVMSLLALPGGAFLVSDRNFYYGAGGAHLFDRIGVRILRETSPGAWASTTITPPSGNCPVGTPLCNTKTPGDVMFASVDAVTGDVWNCQSSSGADYSRIVRSHPSVADPALWGVSTTWTHTVLPVMPDVGHCQQVIPIPGGVAVTTWISNTAPLLGIDAGKSGAYWIRDDGARGEISGPGGITGGKWDNALWEPNGGTSGTPRDGCIITSEQLGPPAGGRGVLRCCP